MDKSPDAFRTISEVADWLATPTHVLRFWESRFTQVKPVKRAGGRRYYRPKDMALLGGIKKLLHDDGMTIRGVQKLLREKGVGYVEQMSRPLDQSAVAPIAVNAKLIDDDNVVELNKNQGEILRNTTGEPMRGPRGDILRGPTSKDLGQPAETTASPEAAKPEPVETSQAKPPVDESPEDAIKDDERVTETDAQEPPVQNAPFISEEPDESQSSEPVHPGITAVAAALRAAASSTRTEKPKAEVYAEVYTRLKTLRNQMDVNSQQKSTD